MNLNRIAAIAYLDLVDRCQMARQHLRATGEPCPATAPPNSTPIHWADQFLLDARRPDLSKLVSDMAVDTVWGISKWSHCHNWSLASAVQHDVSCHPVWEEFGR